MVSFDFFYSLSSFLLHLVRALMQHLREGLRMYICFEPEPICSLKASVLGDLGVKSCQQFLGNMKELFNSREQNLLKVLEVITVIYSNYNRVLDGKFGSFL